MTYLHIIEEFIMTIYHQSNIARSEGVENNAKKAGHVVSAVSFLK